MALLLRNQDDPINLLEGAEILDLIEEIEPVRRDLSGRVVLYPGQVIRFR